MADNESILIVRADGTQFEAEMKKIGGSVNSFGSGAKAAFAAAAAGTAAFVAGAIKSVQAYADIEKAENKLRAVIAATGEASGYSAQKAIELSNALEEQTIFDREAILAGEAIIATFKNVGGEAFPRATKAALDMAAVLGTDVKGASLQLGKALQDPEKGLNALSRAGISFSQGQKELIENFQKTGQAAKAQDLILQQIEGQVGGVAEALTEGTGAFTQLGKAAGNLQETIGRALAPEIVSLSKTLTEFLNKIQEAPEDFLYFKATVIGIGSAVNAVITSVADRIGDFVIGVQLLFKALQTLTTQASSDYFDAAVSSFKSSFSQGFNDLAKVGEEAFNKSVEATIKRSEDYQKKIEQIGLLQGKAQQTELQELSEFEKAKQKILDEGKDLRIQAAFTEAQQIELLRLEHENRLLELKQENFAKEAELTTLNEQTRQEFLLENEAAFNEQKRELFQLQLEQQLSDEQVLANLRIQHEIQLTQFGNEERKKRLAAEAGFYNQLSLLTDTQQKQLQLRNDSFGKTMLTIDRGLGKARLDLWSEGLSAIGNAYNAFGGKNVAVAKGLQIAEITVQAIGKGFQAFAKYADIPIAGLILGGIEAAVIAANAAASIAQLTNAKVNPKGFATGSAGMAPSSRDPFLSFFHPREIVVPRTFSQGIQRGDLALVGKGQDQLRAENGEVFVDIRLSEEASKILQAQFNEDDALGIRRSIF